MKKSTYLAGITLFIIIIGIGYLPISAKAQQSYDNSFDIGSLKQQADNFLDMSKEDAIILLDSKKIKLTYDGRYTISVHRIIRINSDSALAVYGTQRIPYDTKHCDFNIEAARTWADNKWTDADASKIKDIIPVQLKGADDYSNIKEKTIPFSGLKLPCILELAYSIVDKEQFRHGWDGSWTFIRNEPVIVSQFEFELPSGWWPNVIEKPALPPPAKATDNNAGTDIFTWTRGPYKAYPYPPITDPGDTESYILWSTWRDWSSFGAFIRSLFDAAAVGNSDLQIKLDSLMENAQTNRKKARVIAKFINDNVRYINYPWTYWISNPRSAVDIFNSGYGHGYDRAVLAAALFSRVKINTLPAFFTPGYGEIDVSSPGTTRLSEFGLWLAADDLAAYYDPFEGVIKSGPNSFYSRMVWLAGTENKPNIRINGLTTQSHNEVRINLDYDPKTNSFSGSGYMFADNYFAPYLDIAGVDDEATVYMSSLVSSLFDNAKLTSCNPSDFNRKRVIMGFHLEIDKPTIDKSGNINLSLGESTCGIEANLPKNVELFHNTRSSAIRFPGRLAQKIILVLNLKGLDVLDFPKSDTIQNEAGTFVLNSIKTDNKLIIERTLTVDKVDYPPDEWLTLRSLLLADRSEANRKIVLEED